MGRPFFVLACLALTSCTTVYTSSGGRHFEDRTEQPIEPDAFERALRASAAHDLACPARSVVLPSYLPRWAGVPRSVWFAEGCGGRASYTLDGLSFVLIGLVRISNEGGRASTLASP